MATAIHHGPPGSFKSFTLVQRRAIDALKEGRFVVTNIRGFTSVDRIRDQFPDIQIPATADIYFVNTEVEEGRLLMASWFHWVPFKALILIDEAQRVYPDRRDFKLESLDRVVHPADFEVNDLTLEINDEYTGAKYLVHRPHDVFTAFDMQRHFEWDIYLSTPNIAKIKSNIREVAEVAYWHKNMAGKLPIPLAKLFGLYNAWVEHEHDPENSGKLPSHHTGKPRKYHADPKVWACYQSTATGEHTQNKANQSILGDPKLRIVLVVLVFALSYFIYGLTQFSKNNDKLKLKPAEQTQPATTPPATQTATALPKANPGQSPGPNSPSLIPANTLQKTTAFFDSLGYKLLIIAVNDTHDQQSLIFYAKSQEGLLKITADDLKNLGVLFVVNNKCSVNLIASDGQNLKLTCSHPDIKTCNLKVNANDAIINRDCHLYGEQPDPKDQVHDAVSNINLFGNIQKQVSDAAQPQTRGDEQAASKEL